MADKKYKVLIIGEKPGNLPAGEEILSSPVLNLVEATSGKEALGPLPEYNFTPALIDIQMQDCYEAAEKCLDKSIVNFMP